MVKLKVGGAKREGPFFVDPFFLESADALLRTSMIPGAYWYLMPGYPSAQAAILYDLLMVATPGAKPWPWAVFLDIEQPGLAYKDVLQFANAWRLLTNGYPLATYTSQRYWSMAFGVTAPGVSAVLEEAHWVSNEIRYNEERPYASQHVHGVDPSWWNVNYGGYTKAHILQFTDRAEVAGKQVPCSVYPGTKTELSRLLS